MHSPELEMVPVTPFDIPSKPWTAEITPVDLGWRIEKCSRFSLELNKENLFSDEPPFMLTRLYLLIWMGIASLGTLFPFLLLLQQNRLVQILCTDLSFPVLCRSLCRELRTTTGSFASYACPKWNLCGMWVSVKISFSVTLQKNALLTRGGNSTVRVVCLMTITSLCLVRPFFVGCIIFLCRFSFTHPFPLLLQIWLVRLGVMSQKLQQWHIYWKPPLPVSLKTLALTSFLFLTTGLFTLPDQGSSLLPTVLRISCC